ncbi:hypothetical protein BREVUG8_110719 [Brevundimonas sp. G8]|nr:hypothetical protein BREVUG8_110719 [Brevundimonas sp. G8]
MTRDGLSRAVSKTVVYETAGRSGADSLRRFEATAFGAVFLVPNPSSPALLYWLRNRSEPMPMSSTVQGAIELVRSTLGAAVQPRSLAECGRPAGVD